MTLKANVSTRLFGKSIRRNEDERLLKGQAQFVDDIKLSGTLHVAFVRSAFAHGTIRDIDLGAARNTPGVVAAFTAEDLGDYWQPGPLLVPPPPIQDVEFHARTIVPLAKGKIRHVGEPVAVVVAESRYIAEDARDKVLVDIDPLPAVVDLEAALANSEVRVHDDLASNLAAHVRQEKGDWLAAKASADVVLARRLVYDHGTAAAMENRCVLAHWDERADELTVWDTTQAPIPIRSGLAGLLNLSESQVRVVAPFIGGGFGPKIMMFYPDEVLVPWLAMRLGRPVKWVEDREENFYSTSQERSQIHDAEIALTANGRVLGVRDFFLHDTGAYDSYGLTVPINSQCTLLGCYDVPNYSSEFKAVFTNKPLVTPFRGAGRQHGVFVMERLLDFAATQLGIDRAEIRRRNLIAKDDFPHRHGLIYQDFTELTYDSGDYEACLDLAMENIDYVGFKATQQPSLRAEGRRVGIALVTYVEGTGIGPYEGARVTVEASGNISVATGIGTQGQGHFTSFAQIVAEQLGVNIERVQVTTGDTRVFHWGTGTFASRGAVVAGTACHTAALAVREKVLELASDELEAPKEDLVLEDGAVMVRGVPDRAVLLGELAAIANPLRGAVKHGAEPGLEATSYFGPDGGTTANGVHTMIVEIDPETYDVEILRYVVVHDCGTVINPMILEGQIVGGVAQGIGNAFYEQLVFDDQGQLLNGSFMDYLIPTATEVPRIESQHLVTPSPLNPLGIKGAGEAGAIPVGPLFAAAVEDALGEGSPEILEIPLSPNRLFELAHRPSLSEDPEEESVRDLS